MSNPLKNLKTVWYATDHNDPQNLQAMNDLHSWIESHIASMSPDLMSQLILKEVELKIERSGGRSDLERLVDRCAEAKARMDQYGSMNTFGMNAEEESRVNAELVMWQAAYWQARRELQNAVREFASAG